MYTDACYCYLSIEQPEEAKKIAEERINSENISNLEKADFYCILGDIENEEEFYKKAWRISKGRHARAMRSLGTLLVHRKRHAEAASAFEKGIFRFCITVKGM